jgi:hypothetical protein
VAKTFRQLSQDKKMEWSLALCFDELVPASESKGALKCLQQQGACSVSSEHIVAQWNNLRWGLELPVSCLFLPPQLLVLWRDARETSHVLLEAALLQEKYEKIMVKMWEDAQTLLVPVWAAGKDMAEAHWTLLALEKSSGGSISVRYYDTLLQPSPFNLAFAETVMSFLAVPSETILSCRNKSGQGQLECGFSTLYYLEDECRHHLGEGWGSGIACKQVRAPGSQAWKITRAYLQKVLEKVVEGHAKILGIQETQSKTKAAQLKTTRKWEDAETQLKAQKAILEKLKTTAQELLLQKTADAPVLMHPEKLKKKAAEVGVCYIYIYIYTCVLCIHTTYMCV